MKGRICRVIVANFRCLPISFRVQFWTHQQGVATRFGISAFVRESWMWWGVDEKMLSDVGLLMFPVRLFGRQKYKSELTTLLLKFSLSLTPLFCSSVEWARGRVKAVYSSRQGSIRISVLSLIKWTWSNWLEWKCSPETDLWLEERECAVRLHLKGLQQHFEGEWILFLIIQTNMKTLDHYWINNYEWFAARNLHHRHCLKLPSNECFE